MNVQIYSNIKMQYSKTEKCLISMVYNLKIAFKSSNFCSLLNFNYKDGFQIDQPNFRCIRISIFFYSLYDNSPADSIILGLW